MPLRNSRNMNARKWIAGLLPALALAPMAARAAEVDTQFIFGFTMGADVGELGEREIESQTVGRFSKSGGSYAAIETQLRAEITPTENIRIEMGFPVAYHGISGVTGLDDRQQGAFEGVSFEARYRLLDRDHAPFGLTIGAEPHWTRVDDISGESVANYGSELSISLDKELIENRLYGAVNFLYDPEVTFSQVTNMWERQAAFGVSAALTMQVHKGIFFGAEVRYMREYDGIGLDSFAGQALFIGPTMYASLSKNIAVSAAWSVQVAGHAVDIPGSLDLKNFERHRAQLRLMYNF
jgi:hypothetical protein